MEEYERKCGGDGGYDDDERRNTHVFLICISSNTLTILLHIFMIMGLYH
jgi:hypothetical protein